MTTQKHLSIKKVTPKVLEYIHSRFEYNPELGRLISKITTRNNNCAHKEGELVKGAVSKYGYRIVYFGDYRMREHRLIFLMCHGFLPKMLDHIDGNKLNNNIKNLEYITDEENRLHALRTGLKRNILNSLTLEGCSDMVEFYENTKTLKKDLYKLVGFSKAAVNPILKGNFKLI